MRAGSRCSIHNVLSGATPTATLTGTARYISSRRGVRRRTASETHRDPARVAPGGPSAPEHAAMPVWRAVASILGSAYAWATRGALRSRLSAVAARLRLQVSVLASAATGLQSRSPAGWIIELSPPCARWAGPCSTRRSVPPGGRPACGHAGVLRAYRRPRPASETGWRGRAGRERVAAWRRTGRDRRRTRASGRC